MASDEMLLVVRLLNLLGLVPVQAGSVARLVNGDGTRVEHAGGVWTVGEPARRVTLPGEREGEPGEGPQSQ